MEISNMPSWINEQGETLWTCNCGETQTQLRLFDWDGVNILSIYDIKSESYWRTLWNAIRGKAPNHEIVLSDNDLLSLSTNMAALVAKNTL